MKICQKFKKKQKLYALGIALILLAAGSLLSKRSKPSGENTLQPLLVREMYASGSMLERSKTFAARFESYMETAAIPNIREDSTGQDTAIITDPKSDLTLLQEFPEQDIYIWGYNDVEEPGYGLIFDVGDTPHIDSFPYFYESNHGIPPDFILSTDGKTIFCVCHTGFGTGVSVSELILFQLEDFQIESYYLNIDELSDRLNDTIQVVYDADMDAVTVSTEGSDPKSYRLSAVGAEPGERIIPTGYFCGNFLSFSLQGEQLFVHFKPTLYTKAEHATEITERIYTEVLISKFRLSPADRTVSYLAARLEIVDLLPEEILEDLITIEDLFSFSYSLYENGISSPYNKEGMELSIKFMEHAAKYRKDRKINYEQYSLIMGQLSLRLADFSYFSAQYGDCDVSQRKIYAQNAIEKYKESVFYLFNIRDITLCDRPDLYQPEERQSIAFLANNIGSAYILFMSPLSDSEKETVIEVEKVAIKFSNEVSSKAVAVFRRNLGASYERANKMNLAYTEYCESFRLDQKNWKTSHCLGSWYRKQVYVRFPAIPKNLILSDSHISSLQEGERDEMVQMLKHAAYWYELKKVNNSGKPESWLITIYRCIYQMTNDEKYKEKIDWLEDEKRYYDIVFA